MTKTENQRKGDAAENAAKEEDTWLNEFQIEESASNNKGFDYKRRREHLFWK